MKIDHLPLVPKLTKGVGYWDEPIYKTVMPNKVANNVHMAFGNPSLKAVTMLSHHSHKKIEWKKNA
jgi:hypothetical protein